jgi:hypothetical protein
MDGSLVLAARQIRDLLTVVPRALRLKADEVQYGTGSLFCSLSFSNARVRQSSGDMFAIVARAGRLGLSPAPGQIYDRMFRMTVGVDVALAWGTFGETPGVCGYCDNHYFGIGSGSQVQRFGIKFAAATRTEQSALCISMFIFLRHRKLFFGVWWRACNSV